MISLRTCLIALVVVFVTVQSVSSLKCSFCNTSGKCDANIVNGTECAAGEDRCLRISLKDKKIYHLGCAKKDFCDNGLYANCMLCEKENCNTSSFVAPSIFIVTIFAAAVTKMYF